MFDATLDVKRANVAVDQISQEVKSRMRRIGKLNSFQKHTRLILVNLNQLEIYFSSNCVIKQLKVGLIIKE